MIADILILGGGPSGLSTALHLVQRAPQLAARILVLEKARYPRHKLCGGGLTPDAEVILRGLGLDVGEIPHVDASEAHLDFAGSGLVISFRGTHALRMVRREEFDAWLAAKATHAGIQIREGVTVRHVAAHTDSVTVETDVGEFTAAIVVGADGSNGITRRCILPDSPIHTARALELLIPVAAQPTENGYEGGVLPPSDHLSGPLPLPAGEPASARPARLSETGDSGRVLPPLDPFSVSSPLPQVEPASACPARLSETGYAGGDLPPAYPVSESVSPPPIAGEGPGVGAKSAGRVGSAGSSTQPKDSQPGSGQHPRHVANVAYFDFAPVPRGIAGYTWDFPTQLNGQPMRCWGIYDTNLLAARDRPPLKSALEAEMQLQGANLIDVEVQGHPIRWFSLRSQLSVPRVLLVGDAAGADGIFGEGISIALGYGRLAADSILDALQRDDFSFKDYRRLVLISPLGQALTVRTAVTHMLYSLHWAWFQKFFWRVFKPVVKVVSLAIVLNWAKRMK